MNCEEENESQNSQGFCHLCKKEFNNKGVDVHDMETVDCNNYEGSNGGSSGKKKELGNFEIIDDGNDEN